MTLLIRLAPKQPQHQRHRDRERIARGLRIHIPAKPRINDY